MVGDVTEKLFRKVVIAAGNFAVRLLIRIAAEGQESRQEGVSHDPQRPVKGRDSLVVARLWIVTRANLKS